MEKQCCNDDVRLKHRTEEEKKKLKRRLHTIEGQIRGITQMIEDDRYCSDILIQISAVDKSLKSVAMELLKNHLSSCVVDEIKKDHIEIIDEVMNLVRRLD